MERYRLSAFADEASPLLSGQTKALLRNDIGLLEIRGVDGANIADITSEKAKEIRAVLDGAGVRVWSVGSPFGKIGISEPFGSHLEKFKKMLDTADILGCKRIRIFSFYVDGDRSEAVFDEVCKRLQRFLDEASPRGFILCHENEKGIFGEKACDCLKIHERLPGLKAVFDPANFVQASEDTLKAMEMLAPYVDYMHIKDAKYKGEVVPAGLGDGHIPELLKTFTKGVLTVEPHLKVFDGLAKLERSGERSAVGHSYSSSDEAFDAAVRAIKEIIRKEEIQ